MNYCYQIVLKTSLVSFSYKKNISRLDKEILEYFLHFFIILGMFSVINSSLEYT